MIKRPDRPGGAPPLGPVFQPCRRLQLDLIAGPFLFGRERGKETIPLAGAISPQSDRSRGVWDVTCARGPCSERTSNPLH